MTTPAPTDITPTPVGQSPSASTLFVTDSLAGQTGADLQASLTGTQVAIRILSLDESQTVQDQAAQVTAAASTVVDLVIMNLPADSPAVAATLLTLLPAAQHVLWATSPAQAANPSIDATYESVVAAHPNIRVEAMPVALAVLTGRTGSADGPAWSQVLAKVAASIILRYAGTPYRLPLANTQAAPAQHRRPKPNIRPNKAISPRRRV